MTELIENSLDEVLNAVLDNTRDEDITARAAAKAASKA